MIFPDGHQELYAIMGCWTKDDSGNPTFSAADYLPTLIHGFNQHADSPIMPTSDQIYRLEELGLCSDSA